MEEDQSSPSSRAKSITMQLLEKLLSADDAQDVGVRLWDGTLWPDDQPRRGPTFSQRYVFPDGELTPINVSLRAAEEAGFEVRDVESLREHYALTLRHWVRRLEDHHQQALEFVSEPTYRVWRLFMSASAYGFSTGSINVYQSLLVKQKGDGGSNLPLTRADWYG